MTNKKGPVFVSYSHKGHGKDYLELCEAVVNVAGLDIDIWTDARIEAGSNWQKEIESALFEASVGVLLIDWGFLASSYITRKELPSLFAAASGVGGIPIIPILVEDCPYADKLPWLNNLQLEPEHSVRDSIDPHRQAFKKLLTLDKLDGPQTATFKTELKRRLGRLASTSIASHRVVSSTRDSASDIPVAPANASNEPLYSRYLTKGEDLSRNYVGLQINLYHSEFETYRLEVRLSYRDGSESASQASYGLLSFREADFSTEIPQTNGNRSHPCRQLVQASLADTREPGGRTNKVAAWIANARAKARDLQVPLQLRVGISASAGELHEIPWETLPLESDLPAAQSDDILFSRTTLSAGGEAVECQTRARDAWRVLSVYSDVGIGPAGSGNPQLQKPILDAMATRMKELATNVAVDAVLLRPDPDVLLSHLSIGSSFDVLYLACEAVRRDNDYYLRLPAHELSRAELVRHFRLAPVPRLVILVPAHQLADAPENRECTRALMHFAALLSRLGTASVLTCQRRMTPAAWDGFLHAFLAALKKHGHVPGAVAEARQASLSADNWWHPVLICRVKSSRLWYHAGFVSDERPEANWESLLTSLANGRFCPVIGPGANYRLQEARLELAREMADEYDFPLSFSHRISLAAVAQYVRTLEPNNQVFVGKLEKKVRERLLAIADGATPSSGESLRDLGYRVAATLLKADPNNPYNILARLPVGLYLTTNLDPFLEAALDLAKENAKHGACRLIEQAHVFDFAKVDPERADLTGASILPRSEFSANQPVLVQLYGSYRDLGSAAIAEDDYFQFLSTFAQRLKDVKGPLEGKLGACDMVFLGFKWNSLDFRVLFRALQKYANNMPAESFHIAVQIDPDDDETIHPDKALEYLRRYFAGRHYLQQARIGLFWGSAGDFLQELESRLQLTSPPGDP